MTTKSFDTVLGLASSLHQRLLAAAQRVASDLEYIGFDDYAIDELVEVLSDITFPEADEDMVIGDRSVKYDDREGNLNLLKTLVEALKGVADLEVDPDDHTSSLIDQITEIHEALETL